MLRSSFAVFACLVLMCTALPAQTAGKNLLLFKLRHSKDTALVAAYIDYGNWWEAYNLDSAAVYYVKAGQLAKRLGDVNGELRYYANYTYILNQQGRLDKSLELNLEALKVARSHQGQDVAGCLFNIGSSYNNLGNYNQALLYYLQAAALMEKTEPSANLVTVYNNIGGVFTNSGQYAKALSYNAKALRYARLLHDSVAIAKTLVNKGITEFFLDRPDSAMQSISEGLVITRSIQNPYLESIGLKTMADIFIKQRLYAKSLGYAMKALDMAQEVRSNYAETEALKTIAASYEGLGKTDSCIFYASRAIELENKFQYRDGQYKLYDILAASYAGKKDFASAYRFLTISRHLQDSVSRIETEQKMLRLESGYNASQNEKHILSLEKEKKQQQLMIISLAALIMVSLLLAALIYRNSVNRKKITGQQVLAKEREIVRLQKEQQLLAANYMLKGQEDERSRLAKDLHDGLGGLLSGIKLTLIHSYDAPTSHAQDKALQQLDHAMTEMRRIAHSMMPEALVRFGLTDALDDFCASFPSGNGLHIHFQAFGIDERLGQDTEIVLYRIVQELVNNAIRHGRASEIYIQLVRTDNAVNLTVEDNGAGFDTSASNQVKGMGLRNVMMRVDYLNGTLDIQSQQQMGTTVTIDFTI